MWGARRSFLYWGTVFNGALSRLQISPNLAFATSVCSLPLPFLQEAIRRAVIETALLLMSCRISPLGEETKESHDISSPAYRKKAWRTSALAHSLCWRTANSLRSLRTAA